MAALGRKPFALGLAALVLGGCDDLVGLDPLPVTPLARVHVRVTGEVDPADAGLQLRAELTWLRPSLPDPSCMPPAENSDHAAVMAAGCADPLVVAHDYAFRYNGADVAADRTATIDVFELPQSIFGDVTSQIAFATIAIIVYPDPELSYLKEYRGSSFQSMARPDTRLAFRHGGFDDQLAFYPRHGCAAPPPGFSLLSAGGFSVEQAIDAQARGELPLEDPTSCREDTLDRTVEVALEPPEALAALDCFYYNGLPAYLPPPPTVSDDAQTACVSIRDRARGMPSDRHQALVVDGARNGKCSGIQHYVLRGCIQDPLCAAPDWDTTAPPWWPCLDEAQR